MAGAPAPLAITLANCTKTFPNGIRAVDALDLNIHAGETLAFLGPSGCGKTTALRIIAGLDGPDAGGRVLFDGIDVTRLPVEQRNVGMVFQSYALFPNMTVAENIGYGLRIRRNPAASVRTRVAEMLAMMRIEQLAARRVDELSGGQRQRVALARAIAVRPRALLLDEPLTALDARLRDDLRLEIDTLLRSLRITAVYVTHDQAEAMALGDRIVVMENGRIAQVGRPRDIYRQPRTRFVAEFIGTLNRLSGVVRDGVLSCSAGTLPVAHMADGAAEVLFRAEDISIAGDGESADLHGIVTATFFLGGRVRVVVEVGESQPLIMESTARRHFHAGETVRLAIDLRGLLVF